MPNPTADGRFAPDDQAMREMGIEWMTSAEMIEAIPPTYTEWIGTQLLAHLTAEVAA